MDFITDIQNIFPDDYDILVAKNALTTIKKANPKLIVKIWDTYVVGKYKSEINLGDIDFFINKDYSHDLTSTNSSNKINGLIDKFREPIKNMSQADKDKSMKYIQNLTKLSELYVFV
jgi:hypothetical protein